MIVNYRTAALTVDCLRSIAESKVNHACVQVAVVDNASGDGSTETIRQAIQNAGWDWVTLIQAERNGGFAYGNNLGIREVLNCPDSPQYVMLLNPDTLVLQDTISELIKFLEAKPHVGIAGSQEQNGNGVVQLAAHRMPSPMGEFERAFRFGPLTRLFRSPPREVAHQCGWISGAVMMIRREVFEQIGLLDEGFFLYYEEVDLCRRAGKAGWQVWHVPSSQIIHLHGQSTGVDDVCPRPDCWYESRQRFFCKAYGIPGLLTADLLWLLGHGLFSIRRLLTLAPRSSSEYSVRKLLVGDVRAIVSGRLHSKSLSST